MRYPTVEEVAEVNASLVEASQLRDPGLLASAVGRPAQTAFGEEAYKTLSEKVAALFESLACNHAFLDGNKRTAVVAAIHMLNWNGYDLRASDCDVVHLAVDVAEHRLDLPKVAEFFEEHAVPLDYDDDQEIGDR
jgi:death-on-curing protein